MELFSQMIMQEQSKNEKQALYLRASLMMSYALDDLCMSGAMKHDDGYKIYNALIDGLCTVYEDGRFKEANKKEAAELK